MKVDMNVDVEGFTKACEATISRVSRGTRIAAQEGGNTILQLAQINCPRYTGTLMRSGAVSVEGSSSNNYSPGFSATVSFGGGTEVNPITGQHPSEYAAAVHEGFALNPITGELSSYKSGEPKFLEKAIRTFEKSGLQKVAYKHWKQAIYPNGDDFYNPIGYVDRAAQLVDDAMMQRMGAAWFGPSAGTLVRTAANKKGAYVGFKRHADTGELKANPKLLYRARNLSEKMIAPNDMTPIKRPNSLYRRGAYDTVRELAYYLNDLSWGGAEFAASRASDSILALVGRYKKAGWKLTGKDPIYDAYRGVKNRK